MNRSASAFTCPLEKSIIKSERQYILQTLLSMDAGFRSIPVRSVEHRTLEAMLELYDKRFFNSFLRNNLGSIEITMSSRLTSSAGKFIMTKDRFRRIKSAEIRMSSDFLYRMAQGPFRLNGLEAATPQEAFLIVFEHELCHAAETALYGETGHSSRFLRLANGLFGHSETRHSLPTRKAEAAKAGIRVGAKAEFIYQDKTLTGIVSYVGKTATVMVPSSSGVYRDTSGQRFEKYRVPLSYLQPLP